MFTDRNRFFPALLLTLVAFAFIVMPEQATGQEKFKETYLAFAVNMSNIGIKSSATVQITLERWTTEEERTMLHETLMEKGHDAFVEALRKQKETGFVKVTGRDVTGFPSVRLHYATQFWADGKRHINIVTNRPIRAGEARSDSQSLEYDVSAIMLEFPGEAKEAGKKKAKGTGVIYVALKVDYDKEKKKLKFESAATQPIRLPQVELEK